MTTAEWQTLVAAYADEDAAREVYEDLLRARKHGEIELAGAAVLRRDSGGRLTIEEVDDMYGGKGAGLGALVGGALGLLGGPIGVLVGAGVGAVVVGTVAKHRDHGIPDERLKTLGQSLDRGNSAVVAVVPPEQAPQVAELLDEAAIRVTNASIAADMSSDVFSEEVMANVAAAESTPAGGEITAVPAPKAPPAPDDLQAIEGVGPTYAQRLSAAGVLTFADLAALDPAQVVAISKVRSEKVAEEWIAAARART